MEKKRRAILSVTNKTGIVEFALALIALGWEIISTSGTAKRLREAGVAVIEVADVTGFAEMMEGLVRTLHPKIHGGILVWRDNQEFIRQIKEANIDPIDMVVVNLYQFAETVAKPDCTLRDAMWNLDIGGPCLLRAAGKTNFWVTVVCDPSDYGNVLQQLRETGNTSEQMRLQLAAKAFGHTAHYDAMIQHYLNGMTGTQFSDQLTIGLEAVGDALRYGENPHQRGRAYRFPQQRAGTVATAQKLSGNPVSFNNYQDASAAYSLVSEFSNPSAAVIKHANPCGCAEAETLFEAMQRAWEADPVSRFGGIIACNRVIDLPTAEVFLVPKNKVDVIIAPGYDPKALTLIQERKGWGQTVCVLQVNGQSPPNGYSFKQIDGGMLVQDRDVAVPSEINYVGRSSGAYQALTDTRVMDDLRVAWTIVKYVKSNAIVLVRDRTLVGMGCGQPNRVTSVELALKQAGEKAKGAVLASDAFFPFTDGPELAAQAGVTAIIQPGGSVKDQEVIDAVGKYGVAMVFTGIRHFNH